MASDEVETPTSRPSPRNETPKPDAAPSNIEEGAEVYRTGGFHPVYIGDVYAGKYKILNKIGFGVYSTVWLVRDVTKSDNDERRFRALKVLSAESYGGDRPIFEREILAHLRDGDKGDAGYAYVCHLVDDFEHYGPNGTHVCLVFELMGETLRSFGAWFKEDRLPYPVMRRFAIQLVLAVHFAHNHNVIHTDIQPSNIFVRFRDTSLIESRYLVNVPTPQQDKTEERYSPVPSQPLRGYYFGEADSRKVAKFDIVLGDWGVASWTTQHLTEHIQPVALRAPEVLIRAPWHMPADWWNLGALLLELYRAVRMFDGRVPPDGHYELKRH
ncbi:CMGC/SRPK protein kinase [Sporothrix schenckii ATCC 58251]|uniref:non-specific serine/threonine protein kinase n=1 Tax=Sporothrix schenckii (strain ATCC 58251 / de Perez 2211183) TaxID=1391915 RepID=U7Q0Y8_SPOS1|nr:CMGC/SRPK protein kinase [Sporothrix schenckii ATCC 58251]